MQLAEVNTTVYTENECLITANKYFRRAFKLKLKHKQHNLTIPKSKLPRLQDSNNEL